MTKEYKGQTISVVEQTHTDRGLGGATLRNRTYLVLVNGLKHGFLQRYGGSTSVEGVTQKVEAWIDSRLSDNQTIPRPTSE